MYKYSILLLIAFCIFSCGSEKNTENPSSSKYKLEDFVGKWKFGIQGLELKSDKTYAAYLEHQSVNEAKVKNWGFWELSNDTLIFSNEQGGNVNKFIVHNLDSLKFENPRKSTNTPRYMARLNK